MAFPVLAVSFSLVSESTEVVCFFWFFVEVSVSGDVESAWSSAVLDFVLVFVNDASGSD